MSTEDRCTLQRTDYGDIDRLTQLNRRDRLSADEVLGPLGAQPGVALNVTIEIEATAPAGFDNAKVRTVSENAATLKFEQSGFAER